MYEADKDAFQKEVLDCYLNDPISADWDMDTYQKIVDMSANY